MKKKTYYFSSSQGEAGAQRRGVHVWHTEAKLSLETCDVQVQV